MVDAKASAAAPASANFRRYAIKNSFHLSRVPFVARRKVTDGGSSHRKLKARLRLTLNHNRSSEFFVAELQRSAARNEGPCGFRADFNRAVIEMNAGFSGV
jgi:hypothetical protein